MSWAAAAAAALAGGALYAWARYDTGARRAAVAALSRQSVCTAADKCTALRRVYPPARLAAAFLAIAEPYTLYMRVIVPLIRPDRAMRVRSAPWRRSVAVSHER